MEDKRKALYNALSGEYDLGTYEDFTAKLNDESKRRALYDAAGQDYNLGTYEEYSEKLGFGPSGSNVVPMFDDIPQTAPAEEKIAENSQKLRGFWANFKESSKGLWAGLKGYAGEQLNLFTGSSREEQAALNDLEELEAQGFDPVQYIADKEDAQFERMYGMSKADFLALDKRTRKDLVRQYNRSNAGIQYVSPDKLRQMEREQANQQAVQEAFQKALELAGGDYVKAKAILKEQAEDKTLGDALVEDASETLSNLRQSEGFAGWLGNLAPQMIPSATALALNWVTKGRAAGLSKWIGYGSMGGLTLSTSGMSMIEARNAGATNLEVWTTGIADGLIEIISEKIPFDRITGRVFSSAKAKLANGLADAVNSPKGRKELEELLVRANEKLGGKLLSKKNVGDWLLDTAYEAGGEFFAEALQTITPMIYENPEDYPTLAEVLANGWEGAKAGLVMGSVLGGASKGLEHSMNKERRQKQGFVDVAQIENKEGDVEVVEVVGLDPTTGKVSVLHDGELAQYDADKIGDTFRFSYEEFENARLKNLEDEAIDEGTVNNGQVEGMRETVAKDIEEIKTLDPSITDEGVEALRSGLIALEDGSPLAAAVKKLQEDSARLADLESAKAKEREAKKTAARQNIEKSVGQQFWMSEANNRDENGNVTYYEEVEEVVYADGRTGYVVGYDEAGNLSMVFTDGTKGFSSRAEIAEKMNSGEIVSDTPMGLDAYLESKIDQESAAAEQARMAEEYELNVQEMMATHPKDSIINLGTEEQKIEVSIIAPPTKDGVIVQMPDGSTPMLSWEDVAHAEKKEIKPRTDAQNEQSIVDQYKVAYTSPARTQEQAPIAERDAVVKETTPANPLPTKADGSVDQTALWNKAPERWAQWNDEQRQDGGANTLAYVNGAIAKEQAKIAELQAAYEAESDFDARDAIEKEIADTQARVGRLTAIQQGYVAKVAVATATAAPAESAPAQTASVQPAPATTRQERTTESVLASLNDGTLTEEEIRANIDANLAEAQKAYDKYAKKAPKMGTDKDAYLAEKQKYEQGLPALQQEIDFWNGVKQTYETVMQQEILPTEDSFRAQLTKDDMEPQTPAELAARELGLKEGGIKLLWDSVKAHTGFGNGERQKLFGIFRSKDKGGMTIEAAGDRLMEIDREYNLGLLDQSDPMAGVNAILDVLGDAQTLGDLRNYIANNREAQVAREAAAAFSAMNADYEANHGMTMQEGSLADHVAYLELMQGKALSETQNNELNSIFAEEVYQNGTDEYQSETGAVSGSEETGSQPIAVGGAEGVYQDGVQVLHETQSPIGGGEGVSSEQTEDNVSEGNEQDGDTSVHAGEQADEIDDFPDHISESSLDEDMPDFTSSASAYFQTENIRQRFAVLKDRINEWSSKLGVKVRIMETLDDVVNQSARHQIQNGYKVYGFFDVDSGEVAIYLPDFLEFSEEQALSEIDKTYIHEVVSHRGLRGLLGDKKYGELCDKVWKVMTDAQKQRYINYPGVKGNTRAAADEFIAHFAENIDYADNRTLWDKIVDFIKDFLGSIDIPVEISNESMANLLRHSYIKLARDAKAATNANANQQAEGNTVLRAANGSLVGMHNISEEKLRKVIKQGGLANPSTAVVNIAEYLLDGYGEISLIMPSSLVDASTGDNVGTYTGDAWTPTYPPISRKINEKGWKAIKDIVRSVVPEDSPLYYDIINGLENYLEDNRSSKMEFVFLKEKGIEPEIAYKGADGFVGMRNLEAVLGVQGLREGVESYERYKNASPMAKRSFNMWLYANGNKQAYKELKEQIKKEPRFADVLKLNEDVSFAAFDSFTYDIFRKEQDAGKIDTYDTMGAAARYVDANNLRGEFEAWLESLMEQAEAKEVFFAGYTRDGERIYKDNTLENVSRHMRLQGRTNAYDDHGLSATKSALLQRLTSLSQIRKNKARLQNESAYNKEYDALKDRLWSVISQLADMQQISSNQFMNVDYAESRLQEAFTKRNPIAHLNNEYGYNIDPAGEYADELKSFIKDVQQMPAKYFETKFERPVYLNEFAAAVIPTTTREDIKQAVSEAGLPIFEYDSEIEGSRKEATLKATEEEGIRFRTLGEKGAANLDKAEEATIRLDNLAVARQMEEAGKDAKAIKLATGWERGADKLWRYEVSDDFDITELENRLQESLNDGLSKAWGIVYPSDLGELTKAYPDFNVDIMVWVGEEFENTGEYSPATEGDETTFGKSASIEVKAKTVADIKDVFVHEIQHAIQEKEGFAEGGSVFGLKDKLSSELDKRVARIKGLRAEGRDAEADELMRMSKGLAEAVINNEEDIYQNYRKLAGEVEARNVSARLGMSEQERRESLLSETEDVAREDQIVLMDGFNVNAKFIPSLLSLRKAANKIKSWMANDIRNDSFEIPLPNRVLNKIRSVMGRDFDSHNITANGLAHALKNHGEGGKKLSATSIPIRKEDMELVPYIMTAPDRVEKGSTKNNRESVRFIKNISNGYVVVIEKEFDNSADDLETINMWAELSDVSNATRTPDSTSETPTIGRSDVAKIRKDAEDAILAEELNRKKVKSSEKSDVRFRVSNYNQAIFVSNAAKAVEGIKQEKATPEQWLKMIEKNGGLKAGEDKWMGLSDWLKASDKKTLTKQEVLDFINENMIQIEEVHYVESDEKDFREVEEDTRYALQEIYDDYIAESEEMNDDMYMSTHYDYAIQKLAERLGYDAWNAPFVNINATIRLDLDSEYAAAELNDIRERLGMDSIREENAINYTRLEYTTDGLSNKHEIALTVPTIESWRKSDMIHFGDAGEGRAIAWIRFGETKKLLGTTEVEGKKKFNWAKVLVIDEIQSKRHQEGREKGYISEKKAQELKDKFEKAKERYFALDRAFRDKYGADFVNSESNDDFMEVLSPEDYREYINAQIDFYDARIEMNNPRYDAVPDAPFDKNWHELAMKRMLRYAAENGYDAIAWTKGEQQAERYNIGNVVKHIDVSPYEAENSTEVNGFDVSIATGGVATLDLYVTESGEITYGQYGPENLVGKQLSDVVGKDLAAKILSTDRSENSVRYEGDNLRIGGEGMKGFYDKMLPAFMNKYGKKWGVNVEDIHLNLEGGIDMHSVPVTDAMKESVMEGQVMFRMRGENESAKEFTDSIVKDFKDDYNAVAPIEIVDLNTKEDVARFFNIPAEDITDDDIQFIKNDVEKKDIWAAYHPDLKKIVIFVRDSLTDSKKGELALIHENIHAINGKYPEFLALGEYLWNRVEEGTKEHKYKTAIQKFYPEHKWHDELSAYVVSEHMQNGTLDQLRYILDLEHTNILNKILNTSGYGKERKSDRAGFFRNVLRKRSSGKVGRASEKKGEASELTAEERRIINEYFPGAFPEEENDTQSDNTGEYSEGEGDIRFRVADSESKREIINNTEPVDVIKGAIVATDGESVSKAALRWFEENVGKELIYNTEVGTVTINRRSVKNSLAHGYSQTKLDAITSLPEGFGRAVYLASEDDFDGKPEVNHYFVYPINYDGGIHYVLCRVKSDVNKSSLYIHEVFPIDAIKGHTLQTAADQSQPHRGISLYLDLLKEVLYGKDTDNLETTNDSAKNIAYAVNENPTEAQKEAGNYKMGHLNLDGYRITIENPKDSVRRGTDSKGNAWENTLNNDYGYIRGTEGVDGDHIDIYLSDNPTEGNVFVIDQVNPETREFDEHKVMYGFDSAEEAREAYLANFSEGWNGLGTITEVSKDEFKKWIESSHRKTKPFSEYKSVKAIEVQSEGEDMEDNLLPSTGTPTDEVVANGLQLTPAQTAEVAANIFAALPEESRKIITDGLNGNILGLKDAILQIPTRLATKENWNEEDKQMAGVVAEEMTKIAGEMTRPFSAEEGLWLLYNNLNKGTDLVSQASRALVQRNLGFDAETLAKQEQAKEDVRFRTVGDANSNAQASLYNRGAANVWTRLKESYVDMMASVEELVKAIEKRTGKVAQGFENILLALNQQSSKGLAAMESYERRFLNPMFDEIRRIMDETKMKYEDVVRYVILKHGLERNKKLAQRDARAHYQEIYDDIISKITGMTAAQKRTYLTNAQLKEGDAKAELATLQAVDMSAMTDEEKREHKKKLAAARKAAEEAEEHLKRAQKIASMSEQEAQDELDKIFEKIENGTDSVFKEMRENDYSGISSMFYDQLGVDRKNFSTEEQYQAALMEAKKDRYSSLKDVEAAAEAEVKSFEGKTDTKELWKRINAATKETLRQQYEANIISKDQYLNLRDMFEYYVPLRGFKDNTAEDMYTYYRKPNSTGYTKPILGAEGRKTEAESPFGWIAAMAGSAIASNVKNEAKLALYYFVSNRPENGIATISKTWFVDSGEVDERGKKIFKPAYPPFSEDLSSAEGKAQYEIWQANMKELQKKGQAYEAGQRLNLGNAVVNISDANKPEHIVNVKVGGKDYTIIINGNPRAAQAINGDLNIEGTAQDYSALFGPVLRWMSSVNTSYNPEFWITNMMRDMAFTMMAVNIKEDPAYRRKFSKNYRKAFKVISLVAKNEKGTIGDSYLEQQYKDFVKYGGVTGYTQIKDSETWEQEIENYLSSTDPESLKSGKVMRGMKSAFHAAHRFGESLEQVSRFAAFLTARETGKSINEAISDAKEITVNFNRKGSGKMITLEEAKYLTGKNGQPLTKPQQWMVVGLSSIAPLGRRFIMFFNAAIQGLNATYKLMKKNPKRFTGWALGYAAVGMMNAVLHAMMDDDDDYLDIPQYERRNSLMIGGNGAYFKWALPQEARAFYALGDLAVETVMGRNPHQNFLGEALKIGTEILPVNPSEGWKAFMPSVAIPFIELALNEDYKGAPIYNEQKWLSEEEKKRTAKWSSAYQGTGWTYVKIAQGLNFITGGDKHDAGWINLQPEKLEHLVQSAFGGTIRTADKFINTISAALDPEEPMTIRQAPFLNRFLTINDERFKNVHVNDVFDYYKADAEHALTLEKQYTKDRDKESLTELRSSDEYRWAKIYGKYKKPLKAIQDKIKVADGTAEKKDLMKQQDELKKRMIKEISEL